MVYAIRYESHDVVGWFNKAYNDEQLLHSIKLCLDQFPGARIIIEVIE